MILVDTSVWIAIFRDKTKISVSKLHGYTGDSLIVLSRFNQLELLQGAKDEREWRMLEEYLSTSCILKQQKVPGGNQPGYISNSAEGDLLCAALSIVV